MRVGTISVQNGIYSGKNPVHRIGKWRIDTPEQKLNRKDIPQNDNISFKSDKGALKGILWGGLAGLAVAAAIVATGGAAAVPVVTALGAGAGAGAQVGGITGGLMSGKENE